MIFLLPLMARAGSAHRRGGCLVMKVIGRDLWIGTWAFTFCFLSIGLITRWRELAGVGLRPFIAFSRGVIVNVVLGFLLSAVVFGSYWAALVTP